MTEDCVLKIIILKVSLFIHF